MVQKKYNKNLTPLPGGSVKQLAWDTDLKKLVKKKTLINIDKIINWTEIF